jgi:glycosyltransferase involved in cell wall biosynthesis
MTILITAIVCTYNRAEYLRRAVKSLVNQTLPPDQYEIIVVDNASTDATADVIREFSHAPQLRSIYEPIPGLSKARNTGWQNAAAEYVAYLDDDAVAAPDWLEKYVEVFGRLKPGSVGGKCEPIWEAPQPEWLADQMLTSLSVYDWSAGVYGVEASQPMTLTEEQWVSGCNVAYPVAVLRELGGFREDLGRKGGKLLSGEETFIRRQLDARGYATMYHPGIVVGHHISPHRLNKRWFRRHAYGTGITAAVMQRMEAPISLLRRSKISLQKIGWTVPRVALMVAARNPADRFRRQYQILESLGYLNGLWSA